MENKGLAVAILGKGKPIVENEAVDETKEAMLECANGMMKAITASDVLGFKDHLYSFLELWQAHEDGESQKEETEEHAY